MIGPPKKLRILPDEDLFEHVGTFGVGNQFMAFVTGAFPTSWPPSDPWQAHKRWYAVLHKFDTAGKHLESDIRLGGCASEGEGVAIEKAHQDLDEMLESLGNRQVGDISVRLFHFERDRYPFGLVYEQEIVEDPPTTYERVMLLPNDIMFSPPWNGAYST